MTDNPSPGVSRRQLLGITAGLGVASVAGVAAGQTAGGDLRWSFETDGSVFSSPTVVAGTVFVGSLDTTLYAIGAESGEQVWSFETNGGILASPAVADGRVFVGNSQGSVYALAGGTGGLLWERDTGLGQVVSPAAVDGAVVVVTDNSPVLVLSTATGDVRREFTVDDSFIFASGLTVTGETAYLGSTSPIESENSLYAYALDTGEQEWAFNTNSQGVSTPTVADGRVFVGSRDSRVYALDAATGEQVWAFETGNVVRSSPTVAGDTVFVGSADGNLYALSAATGDRQWVVDTGEAVNSSPTVDSGTLYVGTDGGVTALAAGVEGSSGGSRARLGTLGHPNNWRYAGQELGNGDGNDDTSGTGGDGGDDTGGDDTPGSGADEDGTTDEASSGSGDDGLGPGLGAGTALAALGGLALLARRRVDGDSGSYYTVGQRD